MIQDIEIAAANFRDAIEEISPSLESFETFPRGCCGIASLMLGTYLKELGFGEFQIVTGSYGSEAEGNMSSHQWLQSGDLVVDITADQFPDVTERIIVQKKSKWHQKLGIEKRSSCDFRNNCGPADTIAGINFQKTIAHIRTYGASSSATTNDVQLALRFLH